MTKGTAGGSVRYGEWRSLRGGRLVHPPHFRGPISSLHFRQKRRGYSQVSQLRVLIGCSKAYSTRRRVAITDMGSTTTASRPPPSFLSHTPSQRIHFVAPCSLTSPTNISNPSIAVRTPCPPRDFEEGEDIVLNVELDQMPP